MPIATEIPAAYQATFAVFAFLWGAIWGSFLNVVIWRLPRGASLSHPASHCPVCETPIRWYDNVPILGWIRLRGKCRACGTSISARYPGVEALVGVLSLGLWLHAADGRMTAESFPQVLLVFVLHFYFMAALVAIAFIDLDLTIIPHKLSIPLIGWGLLAGLLMPKDGVWLFYFPALDVVESAIGGLLGFGLLFAVFTGYRVLRGVDGGGGGDLWLLAAIGANLGWMAIPFVLFASSFQGVLMAVVASVTGRRRTDANESGGLLIQGAHRDEYWDAHPILGEHASEPATGGADAPGAGGVEDPGAGGADAPAPDGADARSKDAATDSATEAVDGDDAFLQLAVPFGPFLALAAIEYIFIGRAALSWATAGLLP